MWTDVQTDTDKHDEALNSRFLKFWECSSQKMMDWSINFLTLAPWNNEIFHIYTTPPLLRGVLFNSRAHSCSPSHRLAICFRPRPQRTLHYFMFLSSYFYSQYLSCIVTSFKVQSTNSVWLQIRLGLTNYTFLWFVLQMGRCQLQHKLTEIANGEQYAVPDDYDVAYDMDETMVNFGNLFNGNTFMAQIPVYRAGGTRLWVRYLFIERETHVYGWDTCL